ncbi:hypothetical protein P4678_07170 [Priestia megaterium]|uniref:hypothetical protein n=1 Tax=Priestia megaterium TaxID=1404 RepID=UPI002E1FDAF5|nr:hypothetical protein [Priestia megaterium]MED4290704.1 hypothetical protein [Priestia megaterium]MED4294421.1 hypothetical protein [Priestia megaterium]
MNILFKKFRFLWFILLIFALIFVKNTFFSSENAAETLATSDVPQAAATFKEGNNQQDGVIIQKYRKQLDAAQKKSDEKATKEIQEKIYEDGRQAALNFLPRNKFQRAFSQPSKKSADDIYNLLIAQVGFGGYDSLYQEAIAAKKEAASSTDELNMSGIQAKTAALTYGTLAQREQLLVTSLAYDLSSVGVISSDTAKDIDKKATHMLEVRKEGINAAMQE